MSDLDAVLEANREAAEDLMVAAEGTGEAWAEPREEGKWSPAQIVEHVTRSVDEGGKLLEGLPSEFPTVPFFLRPVLRRFVFRRILARGAFPKAKTFSYFDPEVAPDTPAEARARLEEVLDGFERRARICEEGGGSFVHGIFGRVPGVDYIRFIELHTRHHLAQIPAPR